MMFTARPGTLLILLLFLTLPAPLANAAMSRAQEPLREQGPLPTAMEVTVSGRQEFIKLELASLTDVEWAGDYYSQDGPTADTKLSWAPKAGFVVRWFTCSFGPRERVNYGSATWQNGVLKFVQELNNSGGNVYRTEADYVPVIWDEQHYLVPVNRLIAFCYAARNAKNSPEIDTYLLKGADREKRRRGLPNVPPQYVKYLQAKPVIATISLVRPATDKLRSDELTLNVGREDRIVPGMKFYASFLKHSLLIVEVKDVAEHSSSAYVFVWSNPTSEKALSARVGWKLTSRAPRGARNYFPG